MQNWDTYSRQSLDLASSAASLGFRAARFSTRVGFALTRGIASTVVGVTTTIVDHAVFGGSKVTSPVAGNALSTLLAYAEQATLAPIRLGEYITSTSLLAAHSSINVLSVIFPGSSEASFSLASFITLVKREWNTDDQGLAPQTQYGITQVARAIVAWVALQGVTQEWQEKKWFTHLREIHVRDPPRGHFESIRTKRTSRIRVTSDVVFPDNLGQLIAAEVGDAPLTRAQSVHPLSGYATTNPKSARRAKTKTPAQPLRAPPRMSNTQLKSTLRRFSKMVLAGYGGASLLFFGVPLSSPFPSASSSSTTSTVPPRPGSTQAKEEERELKHAIEASELEAIDNLDEPAPPPPEPPSYSWWDVLLGKHDHEIFETYAATPPTVGKGKGKGRAISPVPERKGKEVDVRIGTEHLMPRFWVLTDHGRRQVVLVLRGTMSLNEIAVDLTCEPEEFTPASTAIDDDDTLPRHDEARLPGLFAFPSSSQPSASSNSPSRSAREGEKKYYVHSGMLRMARAMGDVGRPVHVAVDEALTYNLDYELILCGHSLGAGVAAMLGLMWADPKTCLTVRSSGLPVGRRVSVYCFAPPSIMSAPLCDLSSTLITTFVYSHDIVSRLSLGSVRDLRNAAMWLCEEESKGGPAGYSNVTKRARRWKKGEGTAEDLEWFIAVRKTLEANMHARLTFPPGKLLWAMRDSDLHPAHRTSKDSKDPAPSEEEEESGSKLRLFEVQDVEAVFGQIYFARDMLGAHMPHKYDSVLHDLL